MMLPQFTYRVAVAFAIILAVGLPASAGQGDEDGLAFRGMWVLNAELSDDPRPLPDNVGGEGERGQGGRGGGFGGGFGGPGGGFGGRGGGFGGGGRGPGGGRGGDGDRPDLEEMAERRAAMQEAVRDLMTAARRMTIVGTRDEVILTYDDGRVVRLVPDGREHAGLAGTSMQVTRTTRWDDVTLVTDIELEGQVRLEVEQTYDLRDGEYGRQLLVTSRFEGGRSGGKAREFRRVYDFDPGR